MLVAGADAKVTLQGLPGLVPERQRPLATTLAEHQEHVQVEVDVGELQIGQLGAAGAGVQQLCSPSGPAPDMTMTSVAAGHHRWVEVRGFEPLASSVRERIGWNPDLRRPGEKGG